MKGDILRLVFVLLSLPAGALRFGANNSNTSSGGAAATSNASWPPPGPAVCGQATLLTQTFACFEADGIGVFARHGLLLGAVREKSLPHFNWGIDNDFDVGYLQDAQAKVFTYLRYGSTCLQRKGIRVDDFNYRSTSDLQGCKAPPVDVQKQMMAGAPLTSALKYQLQSLCTANSEVPGFSVAVKSTVNGRPLTIMLHGSEFQQDWQGYFYDMCCATYSNCANEVHHWFAEYGGHLLNPGEKILKRFPVEAFQSLKAVPFVLSRSETVSMIVPNDAEAVLRGLYGPNWQKPFNKNSPHEVIPHDRPQAYLC